MKNGALPQESFPSTELHFLN